jgi:hypothetical protein
VRIARSAALRFPLARVRIARSASLRFPLARGCKWRARMSRATCPWLTPEQRALVEELAA